MREADEDGDRVFVTSYADARQLIAWVLGLGEHARILSPPELVAELLDRVRLLIDRHTGEFELAAPRSGRDEGLAVEEIASTEQAESGRGNGHHPEAAI